MANPNTAARYIAKRPYDHDTTTRSGAAAGQRVTELKAEGFDVKTTTARMGPRGIGKGWTEYRVWKRYRRDITK